MRPAESRSPQSWWAAAGAVAATYVFFLIFAEFGLLGLAARTGLASQSLRGLMAALGAGGMAGAALAAWRYEPERRAPHLRALFAACGVVALLAPWAKSGWALAVVFALTGAALGALTVLLAAGLAVAAGRTRLGLCLGLGTGAAYALCNLPGVFDATPQMQAWLAGAVALAAVALPGLMKGGAPREETTGVFAPHGVASWTLAMLALVWMDSAAFNIIQHTPALREATWGDAEKLWGNAGAHLLAALFAGWLMDRGWRRLPMLAGVGLLAGASLLLSAPGGARVGPQWLYTAGVSCYSVALVYFPAASGRTGVAALVYGVSGWLGSALGIAMAENLRAVPGWFVAVAGAVVLGAMAGRRAWPAAAVLLLAWPGESRAVETEELIRRGREVYIGEGCMHCHSQYVRPRVAADIEWWGPARDLPVALAGEPPLPGNRRQGPDLANVGNRRSAEWNRLHLVSPRAVSPGSRMPAYAHLFRGEESKGEALVAYLASLGMESMPTRLEQAARWRPTAGPPGDTVRTRRLFGQLCANCHGEEGHGDGALAVRLSVRPPDWPREGWRHVRVADDADAALARIVKFGLPGSPMAGHEYLPDADVAGLAWLVRELRREAGRAGK